jgi:hypothetical protein
MHLKHITSPNMNGEQILDIILKNTNIDEFRKEMQPIDLNDETRSTISGEEYKAMERKNSLNTSLYGNNRKSAMFGSSIFEPGKLTKKTTTNDLSASVPVFKNLKERSLTAVKEESSSLNRTTFSSTVINNPINL